MVLLLLAEKQQCKANVLFYVQEIIHVLHVNERLLNQPKTNINNFPQITIKQNKELSMSTTEKE